MLHCLDGVGGDADAPAGGAKAGNRFLVITQWAWAYVTYQRGARLITGTK